MITTKHGEKAKKNLEEELCKLNLRNSYLEIPKELDGEEIKDVNEWYCKVEKEAFKDMLEQNIYNKFKNKTVDNYIKDLYIRDIKECSKYPYKKTGFKYLDEMLNGGIRSGLYVIGAIPSLRENYFHFTSSG